jgi:single-stranded DNA-specific DHH superfamily exonuclease
MTCLENRFAEFIRNITAQDKIAVIYHTDTDGICSGVIAAKAVERLRGRKIDLRLNTEHSKVTITPSLIAKLKNKKINKVICVDTCVDQNPKTVKETEKFAEILILDHHKLYNDLNSAKIILIKPQLIKSKLKGYQYPASKLSFDLFSKTADISDLDWIAAVGTIADAGYQSWKRFVDSVMKKYKVKIEKDVFETKFGKAAAFLNYACSVGRPSMGFDILYKAEKYSDVLKSELIRYQKNIEKEIDYYLKNHKKLAEFYPEAGLVFYKIQPKYEIKSALINVLSAKYYPNKTVIVASADKNVKLSARRQDGKVAVNDLLEKAVIGLKGASAGGHIPAAGGTIRKKDLDKFKQNIIRILTKKSL